MGCLPKVPFEPKAIHQWYALQKRRIEAMRLTPWALKKPPAGIENRKTEGEKCEGQGKRKR